MTTPKDRYPYDPLDKEDREYEKARRPIKKRIYYEERRKRVAELRVIGNLTFQQIAERITTYGFEPITTERAWRDYQLFLHESSKALDAVERKAEVIAKLEGLFALAIMAYKGAERQEKDGKRGPDPYARALLIQRATEIAIKLGEITGAFVEPGKDGMPAGRMEIVWVGNRKKREEEAEGAGSETQQDSQEDEVA